MTSDWAGSGEWPSAYRRTTSASHSLVSRTHSARYAGSTRYPMPESASSVTRASAVTAMAPCFCISSSATLTFTNRTCGLWNNDFDAVVKSLQRVPMPITRSAPFAIRFAASVPVAPIAPRFEAWSNGSDPLPACVSETGIPVSSTNARSASEAHA